MTGANADDGTAIPYQRGDSGLLEHIAAVEPMAGDRASPPDWPPLPYPDFAPDPEPDLDGDDEPEHRGGIRARLADVGVWIIALLATGWWWLRAAGRWVRSVRLVRDSGWVTPAAVVTVIAGVLLWFTHSVISSLTPPSPARKAAPAADPGAPVATAVDGPASTGSNAGSSAPGQPAGLPTAMPTRPHTGTPTGAPTRTNPPAGGPGGQPAPAPAPPPAPGGPPPNPPPPPPTPADLHANLTVADNGTGYRATVVISNRGGTEAAGWTVVVGLSMGELVTAASDAKFQQTNDNVTFTPTDGTRQVRAGGFVQFTFDVSVRNSGPTSCAIDGRACE